MTTSVFKTEGMHCASCSFLVEMTVKDLQGVQDVKVNLVSGITTVTYDPRAMTSQDVIEAIAEAGYSATPIS